MPRLKQIKMTVKYKTGEKYLTKGTDIKTFPQFNVVKSRQNLPTAKLIISLNERYNVEEIESVHLEIPISDEKVAKQGQKLHLEISEFLSNMIRTVYQKPSFNYSVSYK